MDVDDVVIYSRSHYDVLVSYTVVREETSRRIDSLGRVIYDKVNRRAEMIGRVLNVGEGWVRVLWAPSGKITCHFPDNLEVMRRRA